MLHVPPLFFFSSRRRHTICYRDLSSDVCSSDYTPGVHGWLSDAGRTTYAPPTARPRRRRCSTRTVVPASRPRSAANPTRAHGTAPPWLSAEEAEGASDGLAGGGDSAVI